MSAGRKYLTPREKAAILEQQCHGCAHCGGDGPFDWDHAIPNEFMPGKPDQALCRPCHKRKTQADQKTIGHVRRMAGETGQAARRKRRGYSLIRAGRNSLKAPPGYKHRWPKRKLETKRSDKI